MSGKLLLFGFDTLPAVLAVETAAGPLGAEVVPVAKTDYNKVWMKIPLLSCPTPAARWESGCWCCAVWRTGWTPCCRHWLGLGRGRSV